MKTMSQICILILTFGGGTCSDTKKQPRLITNHLRSLLVRGKNGWSYDKTGHSYKQSRTGHSAHGKTMRGGGDDSMNGESSYNYNRPTYSELYNWYDAFPTTEINLPSQAQSRQRAHSLNGIDRREADNSDSSPLEQQKEEADLSFKRSASLNQLDHKKANYADLFEVPHKLKMKTSEKYFEEKELKRNQKGQRKTVDAAIMRPGDNPIRGRSHSDYHQPIVEESRIPIATREINLPLQAQSRQRAHSLNGIDRRKPDNSAVSSPEQQQEGADLFLQRSPSLDLEAKKAELKKRLGADFFGDEGRFTMNNEGTVW